MTVLNTHIIIIKIRFCLINNLFREKSMLNELAFHIYNIRKIKLSFTRRQDIFLVLQILVFISLISLLSFKILLFLHL